MNIVFKDSFAKSLKKLKERDLKDKILHLIELIEKAGSISEIPKIKKLSGYQFYYRIRLGDYRIGVYCDSSDSLTRNFSIIYVIGILSLLRRLVV